MPAKEGCWYSRATVERTWSSDMAWAIFALVFVNNWVDEACYSED